MSYANLLIEDKDAVRTITVNRPDKLNALNHATIGELQQAFDAARLFETSAERFVDRIRGHGRRSNVERRQRHRI